MNKETPRLTCYGGVGSVTGANFLLEAAGLKILVDCGLIQGSHEAFNLNRAPFGYDPASIDILFVTHAHLDHVGRIGKLVKEGFHGIIYSSPQTKEIASLIMEDAVGLLAKESERQGVLPTYEMKDVEMARSLWKTIPYHKDFTINDGLSVFLKDAGHILGSSMFEFTAKFGGEGSATTRKIVFTGDLGNSPTPILKDTETISDADYMIMESVYGDRNHEPAPERKKKFKRIINETLKREGVLVIPAFSVERTQVILYELNGFVENNEIPDVPVYVDSPLATKVTEVYKKSSEFFNEEARRLISSGDHIFDFPKLRFTPTPRDSHAIYNHPGPKIVVAGSGMSMGGRVTFHESQCLPDKRNTILLVGYQTMGSLGRALQEGDKVVRIAGQDIEVNAHIEAIFGYSSHKDSDHLVEFVGHTVKSLKRVFIAMGEPKASLFLSQRLRDEYEIESLVPEAGKTYELN